MLDVPILPEFPVLIAVNPLASPHRSTAVLQQRPWSLIIRERDPRFESTSLQQRVLMRIAATVIKASWNRRFESISLQRRVSDKF